MVREASPVVVFQDRVGGNECLDNNVMNVVPDLLLIVAMIIKPLIHGRGFAAYFQKSGTFHMFKTGFK